MWVSTIYKHTYFVKHATFAKDTSIFLQVIYHTTCKVISYTCVAFLESCVYLSHSHIQSGLVALFNMAKKTHGTSHRSSPWQGDKIRPLDTRTSANRILGTTLACSFELMSLTGRGFNWSHSIRICVFIAPVRTRGCYRQARCKNTQGCDKRRTLRGDDGRKTRNAPPHPIGRSRQGRNSPTIAKTNNVF